MLEGFIALPSTNKGIIAKAEEIFHRHKGKVPLHALRGEFRHAFNFVPFDILGRDYDTLKKYRDGKCKIYEIRDGIVLSEGL